MKHIASTNRSFRIFQLKWKTSKALIGIKDEVNLKSKKFKT